MTENTILFKAAQFLEEHIIRGWEAQGHNMTGAWEDSITSTSVAPNHIEGLAKSYGAIVNAGVTPGRIPYGGQPTGATTSKYIQGLVGYFMAKGANEKQALSYAFATAKKQKQQGMSTEASRLYSSTGERQNFLQGVIDAIGLQLDTMVLDGMDELITAEVNELQTQTV